MADRPEKEGNLVVDALQYVTHAIIALRDFDDPDRNAQPPYGSRGRSTDCRGN